MYRNSHRMSSIFARISKLSEKKRKRMKRRQGNSRTNQLETLHRDETLVKYVKYSTLYNVKAVFDFAVIHKYLIGRREIELRIIYLAEENMVLEPSADKYFLWLKKVKVKRLRAGIYLMIKGTYLIYVYFQIQNVFKAICVPRLHTSCRKEDYLIYE